MRFLVTIPVYNEADHVGRVIPRAQEHAENILVVDDGSTDGTAEELAKFDVAVVRHEQNRGYGAALLSAFEYAAEHGYDWVLTMDCDGQHEPESIPEFVDRAKRGGVDIISGTRYSGASGDSAPSDRRAINQTITGEINERMGHLLGGGITDAFCGFKAHRVAALSKLRIEENGYAFPMRFWVQVAAGRLRVEEIPVARIYLDPNRSFGAALDDPETRLEHYRHALYCEISRCADRLPDAVTEGAEARCK